MIDTLLLLLIPVLPLTLALLMPFCRSQRSMALCLTLPPLVAILAALLMPVGSGLSLPWLLNGAHWQLDTISQVFLLFSALIWLIASLSIAFDNNPLTQQPIYRSLFILAMAGNMLLIVAADMMSFYLGFALMGLSAYGMILKPSQRARRSARIYLSFTLVGELALFVAMLLLFSGSQSLLFSDIQHHPIPDLAVALLLVGFGIKLALPGLHPWLPLTYSAAPLISVAVMSGPMMKAGLLGWIRFLPAGADNLQTWGGVLIFLGIGGVLLGSLLALTQQRASAILAYSSIAKMGLATSLFGYALAHPDKAQVVIAALILFAMHHLLVKASLFIGLHHYRQQKRKAWVYFGLILLSLSLIGLPFTGGSGAKTALDLATNGDLSLLLILSGFATALMVIHFLWVIKKQPSKKPVSYEQKTSIITPIHAWLLLIPIAYFGPFTPNSIAFDGKVLLITSAALALFLFIYNNWVWPARKPLIFQAGDIFHLLKRVRLLDPISIKPRNNYLEQIKWPQSNVTDALKKDSLSLPGSFLFMVLAGIMLGLFITS